MLEGTQVIGWFNLISNVGFPAVVALYLLFQYEKRLVNLEKTMETIREHLQIREEDNKDCCIKRKAK